MILRRQLNVTGDEEGDRGARLTAGRGRAPHLGRWHRVPVDREVITT
jgi:hypothetical protein